MECPCLRGREGFSWGVAAVVTKILQKRLKPCVPLLVLKVQVLSLV